MDDDKRTPIASLKARTREQHTSVERTLGARFFDSRPFDAEHFRNLLAAYWGLYRPLDDRLAPTVDTRLDEFTYLSRADRLADDLRALGCTDDDLADLPTLSEPKLVDPGSRPELLGVLYVIEGSALGNRLIHRQLASDLGAALLGADAFFHDDGPATSRRWQSFRTLFDRHVTRGPALASAVRTATATFEMYEEWFA